MAKLSCKKSLFYGTSYFYFETSEAHSGRKNTKERNKRPSCMYLGSSHWTGKSPILFLPQYLDSQVLTASRYLSTGSHNREGTRLNCQGWGLYQRGFFGKSHSLELLVNNFVPTRKSAYALMLTLSEIHRNTKLLRTCDFIYVRGKVQKKRTRKTNPKYQWRLSQGKKDTKENLQFSLWILKFPN